MPEDVAPTGDFGEFVTAMKAEFDPNDPSDHADDPLGLRDRCVFLVALYGLTCMFSRKHKWLTQKIYGPLAMSHPWKVFVGPILPAQRQGWRRVALPERFETVATPSQ